MKGDVASDQKPCERTTTKSQDEVSCRAKQRWKLLAEALRIQKPQTTNKPNKHSVRRFKGFNLFDVQLLVNGWQRWKLNLSGNVTNAVDIRLLENKTSAEELIGFNNTGNICIWPAEEVLAYYMIKYRGKLSFRDKQICELGAGMAGLAGFQVALNMENVKVIVTDGNESSVENLEVLVERAKNHYPNCKIQSRLLIWNNSDTFIDLENQIDIVICADCLFFTELHGDLLHTMTTILKPEGICIIFAPRRSGTLDKFVWKAQRYFNVTESIDYDTEVTNLHETLTVNDSLYTPDIHFPIYLMLTKLK